VIDFDQVEGFESEAEQVFFSAPVFVVEDIKHSQGERRFHALGKTEAGGDS
jgi:hypothetical protein